MDKIDTGEDEIYEYLAKTYAYAYRGNQGQAKKIIYTLINKDLRFVKHPMNLEENLKQKYTEDILNILSSLSKVLKNTFLLNILKTWFYNQVDDNYKMLFSPENKSDLLKMALRSYTYGLQFPGVWYETLSDQYAQKVVLAYLDEIRWKSKLSTDIPKREDLIFKYYLPIDKGLRVLLRERWNRYMQSEDLYARLIAVEMLQNVSFVQLLQNNKVVVRPYFVEARLLYRQMLKDPTYHEFALLNLLKMGDNDLEL